MEVVQFEEYQLKLYPTYIQLTIYHETHFDTDKFETCFKIKVSQYGNNKVGVIVNREDLEAHYSFDPMILLMGDKLIENHVLWVAVVAGNNIDYKHLEYVKQLTTIPCTYVDTFEEAYDWIKNLNSIQNN